jgi:phosphatidylglycerol:prolipoprotein diacylglycerol transferase
VFPPDSPAGSAAAALAQEMGRDTVALHPAQAYSSLKGLLIFLTLMLLAPKLTKPGSTFGLLLVLYGIGRFVVDFFRMYEDNARILLGLTFNQVISIGLVGIGLYLLLRRVKQPSNAVA